ncbi:hypothetical protein E0765_04595 [Sulfuricurvum sp. IAE1]|uniref:SIR2 family protein n=1 Tax=Sulfuricurvum sp. IAE1 TaxID=2546102 RepID=UPI00104B8C63|nr:SIR2 family protein [Sulfuricurvum sp. IAE1]TDA65893.1 hypothetical protein E0765_04595 [Sulfuricurvum sp. IAE1]
MRFIPDGPFIPDALLTARDEGRVVFFCGAGVSRSSANLPDFLDLTKKVISELGVGDEDAVSTLLLADERIKNDSGERVLSLDRIFGLLEQDFNDRDIEAAVARVLKPNNSSNLFAHQTMLKLAKTSHGSTRIVTTNFDRLFESCDRSLPYFCPPKLPDPSSSHEFNGIIHLHGIVNEQYTEAEGNGFVLSSSEFGHAYLAEGWATQFIKTILEKYIVVFVGYSADDPPIRYLLEAFNKHSSMLESIYAFHYQGEGDAQKAWSSKGVIPIEYETHEIFWASMQKWALRAENPEKWIQNVLNRAKKGPVHLQPHERGQVAHIVSNTDGMRQLAIMKEPLSAEWLCVFDANLRYAKPPINLKDDNQGKDPFDKYALDSDIYIPIDSDSLYAKREVPLNAWNCFTLQESDKKSFELNNISSLMGHGSMTMPALPKRLSWLGEWIVKIADDPITIWWACKQKGVHPEIVDRIQHCYRYQKKSPEIDLLWENLSIIWSKSDDPHDFKSYVLEESFKKDQLSLKLLLKLLDYYHPTLNVDTGFAYKSFPPIEKERKIDDVVHFEIDYRRLLDIEISDEFLVYYIKEFRHILEKIVVLEKAFCRRPSEIDPIYEEDDPHHEISHDDKISAYVIHFVKLMQRLIGKDISAAKQEFLSWGKDNSVFARLSIWISGEERLFPASEAAKILLEVDDNVFWSSAARRDLLITLKKRWNDYDSRNKKQIEKRILQGRKPYDFEPNSEYLEGRSWDTLTVIHWLALKGCTFTFDVETKTRKLIKLAPDWKKEYAQNADRSLQGRGGFVRTNTDYDDLVSIPLKDVLTKSVPSREEFLLERRPFSGLSEAKSVRAFLALSYALKHDNYPTWAWETFLHAKKRETDCDRLIVVIGYRLLHIPIDDMKELIYPVIAWYEKIAKKLFFSRPDLFDFLWNKLINLLETFPEKGEPRIKTNSKHYEWLEYAINTPQGRLAHLLMELIQDNDVTPETRFPEHWISRIEQLLHLSHNVSRFTLVVLSRNINWFFYIDPEWTVNNLLSYLDGSEKDKEAFMNGFLRGNQVPRIDLYRILKPYMLELSGIKNDSRNFNSNLSGILLVGWNTMDTDTGEKLISDEEMKKILIHCDENFRLAVLSNLLRWIREESSNWIEKISEFLQQIWPLHKKAKSTAISAQLCDLAFSNINVFPVIIKSVIYLVKGTTVSNARLSWSYLRKSEIVDQYPENVLDLLFVILPENPRQWPYGINDVLDNLLLAKPSLNRNFQYIELKRRWNAR